MRAEGNDARARAFYVRPAFQQEVPILRNMLRISLRPRLSWETPTELQDET
jgi:hypothetical protein